MTPAEPRDSGGFISVGDRVVHEWAMFRLVRRSVTSPDGAGFERTFVSTPGAVGVIAVDEGGNLVLVSQYRASVDSMVLEIPAGMRDVEGEDPILTASRELREETGYEAARSQFLGRCVSSPGVTDSQVDLYLLTGLSAASAEPHGPEEDHMQVIHIPFAEAIDWVMAGRITDAKTVCGVLMAARMHPELVD